MSDATEETNKETTGPARLRVERLPSVNQLEKIIRNYLLKTAFVTKLHQKTAWITAGFPAELCYLFGITPMHPEQTACISGASKISLKLIEYAESLGFSRDLCSYFKTNLGAVGTKISLSKGNLPKPTFLASTNTICDTHVKWFEIQAREFGVPYFQFDVPNVVSGTDDEHMEEYIDYVVDQVQEYVDFAQKITGKKFSEKKYNEILQKSAKLSDLWQEIYEYRKLIPTPVTFQDTMASIFPLVILSGLDTGIKFYDAMLKDIKARVAKKTGAVTKEQEKYRIMFEGIPMWYRIAFFYQLSNYGAIITYEPYTFSFGPKKKTGLPMDQMMRELARLIIDTPYNYSVEKRIKYFEQVIDDYKIDGIILHSNMSCRPSCTGMIDLKNAIQKDKGIPVWLMDCDMDDPRAYAEEPMMNRMESFVELMAANKK